MRSAAPAPEPADLGHRFAAGDERALREVFEAHGRLVFSICRRGLPSEEAAEDAAQQAFVAAWQGRARFDPAAGTLAGWLAGIARHKVLDAQRSLYRGPELVGDEPMPALLAPAEVDRLADRMVVASALERLEPERRAVVESAFIDGLTHPEVAERHGLPLGTVKSHIRRALDTMRRDLEASDG